MQGSDEGQLPTEGANLRRGRKRVQRSCFPGLLQDSAFGQGLSFTRCLGADRAPKGRICLGMAGGGRCCSVRSLNPNDPWKPS